MNYFYDRVSNLLRPALQLNYPYAAASEQRTLRRSKMEDELSEASLLEQFPKLKWEGLLDCAED